MRSDALFRWGCYHGCCLLVAAVLVGVLQPVPGVRADPLVPALCIFGDSVVDVGNNNRLLTLIKANFPPYGRDFVGHRPTGRFCNGKLATDFTGTSSLSFSYPSPCHFPSVELESA